jgi:large subunit ribosomal protein L15
MRLHDLSPAPGSRTSSKRIGRGHGSGKSKTAGKGSKGQNARAGGGVPNYFEGGQLPLVRKLPYRRGFNNPFRKIYREVNISVLGVFPEGSTIGPEELEIFGLLRGDKGNIKVLGDGEMPFKLNVRAHKFTKGARSKIEAAGGTAEEII